MESVQAPEEQPHRRRSSTGGRSSQRKKSARWPWLLGLGVLGAALAAGAGLYFVDDLGITPRSLGPYIGKRSDGHNAVIEGVGRTAKAWLTKVDRGDMPLAIAPWTSSIGAQPQSRGDTPAGQEIVVGSAPEVARAVANAAPGQVITLLPGRYYFTGVTAFTKGGTAAAPITVRAREPGSVTMFMNAGEAFKVMAPYWRFENLTMTGKCEAGGYCEHAFHVTGNAHHFVAVNNTIMDFDAHFKINGSDGQFPDYGVIEGNTLRNNSVRVTTKPVTPIDLVAASHWRIARNYIADFIKGDSDMISYGAFVKGAGSNNVLEQNIVICEDKLRGLPGQRIGLSLGGGGTGKPYCRDGRCIMEQTGSTLRANLVASCSDDGIYLNAATRSKLVHNTLLDTGGITVRFPTSTAEIEGNLVDGIIRSRDGGLLHMGDNRYSSAARLYLGSHPQRDLFREPLAQDFGWRRPADRRVAQSDPPAPDLCGGARPATPRFGAFEDFATCLAAVKQ